MRTEIDLKEYLMYGFLMIYGCICIYVCICIPDFPKGALVAISAFVVSVFTLVYSIAVSLEPEIRYCTLVARDVVKTSAGTYSVTAMNEKNGICWKFQTRHRLDVGDCFQFMTKLKKSVEVAYVITDTGDKIRARNPEYWVE